jgi:hypothetical protein
MSVLHNLTSTVAAVQGEDGAVIPESLDLRNEGRAQLMVRGSTAPTRCPARGRIRPCILLSHLNAAAQTKVSENNRSGQALWKGLTSTIMDRHTRKWLGIAAVDGDTEETRRRKRLELRRQRRDAYIAAHPLIMRPDGRCTRIWDEVQLLLLLYLAVVVPYRIGFNADTEPGDPFFVVDVLVDLYFVIDTITGFFRAYYDDDGMLQYRPMKKLAWRYGSSRWFLIDLVSCLPVNYVHFLYEQDKSEASTEETFRANKVLRLLRLFRLLRLLRLTRLQRIIDRHEEEVQQYADVIRMMRTGIFILWITHVVACVWYFAGNEETGELNPDGTTVRGWVEREYGPAEDSPGNVNGTVPNRYVASLYYAAMTMTTVGYGDITPATTVERMTSVVCMMLGGYIFGIVVGIMSEITRNASFGESFKDMELGKVISLLRANDVPPSVSKRIRSYFVQHYLRHSAVDVAELLCLLPESLRDDLASHLNPPWVTAKTLADEEDDEDAHHHHHGHGPRESMLQHVPFFCDLDNHSLILICSRMKLQTFLPAKTLPAPESELGIELEQRSTASQKHLLKLDHYIIEEGDYGNEMFVITDGLVGVECEGNALGQLKQGDFFGENAVLRVYSARGQLRTRSHYAMTKATVAILSCVFPHCSLSSFPTNSAGTEPQRCCVFFLSSLFCSCLRFVAQLTVHCVCVYTAYRSDDLNDLRKSREQIDLQLRPFMRQGA